MINSMTGFGGSRQPITIGNKNHGQVHVELRSVNSRFLDLSFKSPEEARFAEHTIRDLIVKKIHRGKVELKIYLQKEVEQEQSATGSQAILNALNTNVIEDLKATEALILKEFPNSSRLSVRDVLQWPGVMRQDELDQEILLQSILSAVEQALVTLTQSRASEGQALTQVILGKLTQMGTIIERVEPALPKIIESYQQKLTEKLLAVLNGVDQQGRSFSHEDIADRIRQEVVLYGVRIDVAEEIARLKTHLKAVANTLEKGGPVGKKLDFLMQELQRESNTLGAKSVHQETSDASMELKLLVEQIREQVQNLE